MAFFTRQGRAKSLRDLSRPSFMDRKSGMRREDRMPVAAMDRKSGMWRDAYRDVGGRPRLERAVEGTPAWMQAVDGVGNRPSRRPAAAQMRPCRLHPRRRGRARCSAVSALFQNQ